MNLHEPRIESGYKRNAEIAGLHKGRKDRGICGGLRAREPRNCQQIITMKRSPSWKRRAEWDNLRKTMGTGRGFSDTLAHVRRGQEYRRQGSVAGQPDPTGF